MSLPGAQLAAVVWRTLRDLLEDESSGWWDPTTGNLFRYTYVAAGAPMATLAAGDVTTQMRLWLDTNCPGNHVMKQASAALVTATSLPATTDATVLWAKYIAR